MGAFEFKGWDFWTMPPLQMKMRRTHKIALYTQALKIFEEQRQYVPIQSDFVFPAVTMTIHLNRE